MNLAAPSLGNANALKCELAGEVLRSSGTLRLRVTGWSMLPTVMPGDTLVIEHVSSDAVSEGDIVLFVRDRRFFVHRVVTKGVARCRNCDLRRCDARPGSTRAPKRPAGQGLFHRAERAMHRAELEVGDFLNAPSRLWFGAPGSLPVSLWAYTACDLNVSRYFQRPRFKLH